MNNELLERVTFKDVFETKEIFASGWSDSGYSGITSTNVNIIYNLLYARYCNSTVASIDIDRFKSQVYAIMYMHGPAWQKKQAIQDYIYALDEDDIRVGSTTVLNTAQNPSTSPATDAFTALTKIDSQNASRTISSPIKAYAELRTLVEDGFTETFIDKFKKLFIVVLDTNCNLPPILRVRGNHIYTGDTVPEIGYPYWEGDLFVKTNGDIYQYNVTEWTFILSMAGELTPEILLEKIEGSDYISVDLNETDDKVKIELDETKLDTEVTEDSDNLITSGAVFDAISDSEKLVEVTYGVTTYDEITALLNQGKIPTLLYNGRRYNYETTATGGYQFSNVYNYATYQVYCSAASSWGYYNVSLEILSNKEQTITPSSTTKYPSSKAVADYTTEKINGVFELDGTDLYITTY